MFEISTFFFGRPHICPVHITSSSCIFQYYTGLTVNRTSLFDFYLFENESVSFLDPAKKIATHCLDICRERLHNSHRQLWIRCYITYVPNLNLIDLAHKQHNSKTCKVSSINSMIMFDDDIIMRPKHVTICIIIN
jgi:hypothetical protein